MGTINYDIYENPSQNKDKKRYHVRVANSNSITYEEVKEKLSHSSSVTPGDIDAVITGVCDLIVKELSNGMRVSLGELGYFSPSIQAPSVDNPKEINASKIRLKGINYRNTSSLLHRLQSETQMERARVKIHSERLSTEEIENRLKEFFKEHDNIGLREFKALMNLTESTAVRRLRELCKGTSPVLKHIGTRNSSMFILADKGQQ
jgi:predicted histone-like DNA-binding protein